jgi:hypothetical protein
VLLFAGHFKDKNLLFLFSSMTKQRLCVKHPITSLYGESSVEKFFSDDADRNNFVDRLGGFIEAKGIKLFRR